MKIYIVWQTDGYEPYPKYYFAKEEDAKLCAERLAEIEIEINRSLDLNESYDDDYFVQEIGLYQSYESWKYEQDKQNNQHK